MIGQCLNGPVKDGDMVRMVLPKPCCGDRASIGREWRVRFVLLTTYYCGDCGARTMGLMCLEGAFDGAPPGVLIRLDPRALPEGIETVREVSA